MQKKIFVGHTFYYFSPRPKVKLSASKVHVTAIPPRELVSYCKETQTPHQTLEKEGKITINHKC